MSLQILKERLNKGCVGVSGGIDLAEGVLAGGKNIRRADVAGGWRGRKGNTLRNLEALPSIPTIRSQFAFVNPFTNELHLITQCRGILYDAESSHTTLVLDSTENLALNDSTLLLLDGDGDKAYVQQATLGFDTGVTVSYTNSGYGAVLRDRFFYADGSSGIITYGGLGCYVTGFMIYDNGDSLWRDGLFAVVDGENEDSPYAESPPYALVRKNPGSAPNPDVIEFYVCSPERAKGFEFVVDGYYCSLNRGTFADDGGVYAWRGGSWVAVSDLSDGTRGVGTLDSSLYQSGTISWASSTSDCMKVMNGIQGYWYKFYLSVDTAGLTGLWYRDIRVTMCKAIFRACRMTNKWDGIWAYPTGFMYYNGTTYVDCLGRISNESESQYVELDSAGAANTIHIKSEVPLTGFGLGIIPGKGNTNAVTISSISHAGTNVADVVDGTSTGTQTLAHTGHIFFDASSIVTQKTILGGDKLPGYWYTITLSGALDSEVELYLCLVAKAPGALTSYRGVVAFDDRLVAWGDPKYPNRLRVSPVGFPDFLGGPADNYSDPAGDITEIIRAVPYGAYLVVFKKKGIWLCSRDLIMSQITTEVGLNAPNSVEVSEIGTSSMSSDQIKNIVIWSDVDGCYMFDLNAVRKISLPVDQYFNPRYAGSWPDDGRDLANLISYNDVGNNEYHLIEPVSGEELVFNYAFEQWYPVWERCADWKITCGLSFKYDSSYYLFAGTDVGLCLQLESGVYDVGTNNEDYVIEQQALTRLITPKEQETNLYFDLKELWFLLASSDEFDTNEFLCSLYENFSSSASVSDFVVDASGSNQYKCIRTVMARQRLIAFQLLVEMTRDLIPADTDIFGWWPGSPGFGVTAIDCSGESNNGTLMNGVAWGTGDVGKCFEFDGVDGYIDLGVQGMTGSKTISAWIYWDSANWNDGDGSPTILSDVNGNTSGFQCFIAAANGELYLDQHYPSTYSRVQSNIALSTQTWHHVAVTYNPSTTTAKIYIDGVLACSPNESMTNNAAGTRILCVGGNQTSNSWLGKIADVRIYERALSEAEILGLATNPLGRLAHIRELMYSIEQRRVIT